MKGGGRGTSKNYTAVGERRAGKDWWRKGEVGEGVGGGRGRERERERASCIGREAGRKGRGGRSENRREREEEVGKRRREERGG